MMPFQSRNCGRNTAFTSYIDDDDVGRFRSDRFEGPAYDVQLESAQYLLELPVVRSD